MKDKILLTESELIKMVKKILNENSEEEKPFEKGKRGIRAARSRFEFEPTPLEREMPEKLFGKYGEDVPPIVIRYLRKIPRKTLAKRLIDLGLIKKEDFE